MIKWSSNIKVLLQLFINSKRCRGIGVPFGQLWFFISSLPAMHDSTMMKTRWYDDEIAMVRWWNRVGTMMKSIWYDDEIALVRWWNRDGTMMKTLDGTMKLWKIDIMSCYHHRTITISTSYHRVFIIVTSCFHHHYTTK